jgi:aspartyl protease family protein
MPFGIPHIAIYALLAALAVMLLQRIPYVGRAIRFLFSLGLLAVIIFLLLQQAPYQPELARITQRLGLDEQQVSGKELRVKMASDGHFWVTGTINGVKRRMLIDSGATITALSNATAEAANVSASSGFTPVILRTANGAAPAQTGTVEEVRIGNIVARDLKVVTAPGLGSLDVLGMNFLSQLKSCLVEDGTLILVANLPQKESGVSPPRRPPPCRPRNPGCRRR